MEHVANFGLSYGTIEEFNFRHDQFQVMDAEYAQINAEQDDFTVGHNFLSTWTAGEKKRLLGYMPIPEEELVYEDVPESNDVQASVNWVTSGAVGAVKNQGSCGSCWSFSATGTLEGAYQIAHGGSVPSYSEQLFVSCDSTNYGCEGGVQTWAFAWAKSNTMMNESTYSYTSGSTGQTGSCKSSGKSTNGVKCSSYRSVSPNDPNKLTSAISEGPVSVAIQADRNVF